MAARSSEQKKNATRVPVWRSREEEERGGKRVFLKPVASCENQRIAPAPLKFRKIDKITPLTPKLIHNDHLTTITRIPLNPDLNSTTRLIRLLVFNLNKQYLPIYFN